MRNERRNPFLEQESGRAKSRVRDEIKDEWRDFVDGLGELLLDAAIITVGAIWILIFAVRAASGEL